MKTSSAQALWICNGSDKARTEAQRAAIILYAVGKGWLQASCDFNAVDPRFM